MAARRSTELVSVIVAVIAAASAGLSAFYTYTSQNRQLDIELVKLGIGILRVDPTEAQTNAARGWAVDVIEKYSRLSFSEDAKKDLLKFALNYKSSNDNDDVVASPARDTSYSALRAQLFPNGSAQPDKEIVEYVRGLFSPKNIVVGVILSDPRYSGLRRRIGACIEHRKETPCETGSLAQFF